MRARGHAAAGLRRPVPHTMGDMAGRLVIRDLALADGTSAHLQIGIAVVIDDGHIRWLGPTEEADAAGAEVLDGGGATLMPGLVDAHSHLSGPGGSHWIERFSDPLETLRQVGRDNARRLVQAGVLWARDVGAPTVGARPVNLQLRDELRQQAGQPYIRAAGTWLAKTGYLPITIGVDDGAQLLQAALGQLDGGADFVKIMLDAPAGDQTAPFSVDEVSRVVQAVHARGKKITAHATIADGARVAAGWDLGGGWVRAAHRAGEVELLVRAGRVRGGALGAVPRHGGELLGEP